MEKDFQTRYQELPEEAQKSQKATYRHLLAQALWSAHGYQGTETGYKDVFNHLIALENWLKESNSNGKTLTEKQETEVAELFHPAGKKRTISEILQYTSEHFASWSKRLAHNQERDEALRNLNIHIIQLPGVVLPTQGIKIEAGKEAMEVPGEIPKFDQLLAFLNNHGIFTDDLVICVGDVDPAMIRKHPYYLVEIPRLNRSILVCDQMGEATFVTYEIFSRDTLMRFTKDELKANYGPSIQRIIYRDQNQWESALEEALFFSNPGQQGSHKLEVGKKIDIQELEKFRAEIKRRSTPEQWVEMTPAQRRDFEIFGKGMRALATLFGVPGQPTMVLLDHLELGARIFGSDVEVIKKKLDVERLNAQMQEELGDDPQKWSAEIRKNFTLDQWINCPKSLRPELKLYGMGLQSFVRIFGLKLKNKWLTNEEFYLLCGIIFGAHEPLVVAALKKAQDEKKVVQEFKNDPQKIITEAKGKYTDKQWVTLSTDEIKAMVICGLKVGNVAKILGMAGKIPKDNWLDFLELGLLIFGQDNEVINAEIARVKLNQQKQAEYGEDKEKWKAEIQLRYTPEQLRDMSQDAFIKTFDIYGHRAVAIARLFGLSGDPRVYRVRLEIMAQIYGEDHPAFKEQLAAEIQAYQHELELGEDIEKWKTAIVSAYPLSTWLAMLKQDRMKISILGKSFHALGNMFDIKRSPRNNRGAFLELTAKIYGQEAIAQLK